MALASVFLFGGDRGTFYQLNHASGDLSIHNWASTKNLALATNLSSQHRFALFLSRFIDDAGTTQFDVYGRFPLGGYLLIKLAILPWQDYSTQILAARMLMLLMFCGAASAAYLAVRRLTGCGWSAVAVVGVAFSSYVCLHFSDAIDNESSADLFAMLLAFHGMVVYVQQRRLPQMLLKVAMALLIGWHVFAILLPFVAIGLLVEFANGRNGRRWREARCSASGRSRSP